MTRFSFTPHKHWAAKCNRHHTSHKQLVGARHASPFIALQISCIPTISGDTAACWPVAEISQMSLFFQWRRARLMLAASLFCAASALAADDVNWPNVGNDKGGMRYSTLAQINRENVDKLQPAWTYHTGDGGEGTTIECTPLVIDGVMYITTVRTKVIALNAATGSKIWEFDPYAGPTKNWIRASGGVNRGVAYWSDGKQGGQRRVIVGLSDGRLISLDAQTGHPDANFAEAGTLDLRKG